ncbi:hypothetical protein, partial [Paenibacillus chitinolyticus]|uniref:hypothetical protein n=1 Tax=Paenibacillus chitinolyticus TaxID=79263 RepID=UPI00295F4F7C
TRRQLRVFSAFGRGTPWNSRGLPAIHETAPGGPCCLDSIAVQPDGTALWNGRGYPQRKKPEL